MSFGGGPSRKELLETVENQKKQLVQYQTRFKDVVQAYKSLLKEKEALEASLKVLTVTQDVVQETGTTLDLLEDGSSLYSEDSVDTAVSVDTEMTRGDQSEDDHTEPGRSSSTVCLIDSSFAYMWAEFNHVCSCSWQGPSPRMAAA